MDRCSHRGRDRSRNQIGRKATPALVTWAVTTASENRRGEFHDFGADVRRGTLGP